MKLPNTIQTEADVRAFFTGLMREEDLNFHPDTPFTDYVDYATGLPTYTHEESHVREQLLEQCFAVASDEVYTIGLEIFRQAAGFPLEVFA